MEGYSKEAQAFTFACSLKLCLHFLDRSRGKPNPWLMGLLDAVLHAASSRAYDQRPGCPSYVQLHDLYALDLRHKYTAANMRAISICVLTSAQVSMLQSNTMDSR